MASVDLKIETIFLFRIVVGILGKHLKSKLRDREYRKTCQLNFRKGAGGKFMEERFIEFGAVDE
ncbi:hypothetical protein HPG69_013972 [Diceros bicornis minor]|uniref:Uncharacterized protein n=1 Tax=Diceros bicornis minor TaxID=77932 RepID=A0A7J7EMT8_DICBM|nr:hypothetical protein HPG69_013972 [Diceros bicornis minor]